MKTTLKLIPFLIIITVTILSCSKDDDNPNDTAQQQDTYTNYSVAGNQVNGTYNIVVEDLNNPSILAFANVYPESNSQTLKIAGMGFVDTTHMLNVGMSIPARTGLVEILDDHPDFDLGFGFEDVGLEAKSISVNVLEIERNDNYVIHIKGTFNGIAVYKHTVNGDEIEETHIIDGEFEYNIAQ
ncbi:hypothetical protein [Psychroserpens ponticola]|uniref:DUF4251 domain-containing protein n=1 Tax=Psychroserpens ponticola TaxID=2932268 RepID=A0ABY7S089_9FLAO|nr:hypothetical protein [Psychroserpens ponticola]WCO02804.1 hypothetical protein MUN68_004770 [Psychroserpens ponticola]